MIQIRLWWWCERDDSDGGFSALDVHHVWPPAWRRDIWLATDDRRPSHEDDNDDNRWLTRMTKMIKPLHASVGEQMPVDSLAAHIELCSAHSGECTRASEQWKLNHVFLTMPFPVLEWTEILCRSQNVNQLHFLPGPTHQQGGGEERTEEGDGGTDEGQKKGDQHQLGDSRILSEGHGMPQRLYRGGSRDWAQLQWDCWCWNQGGHPWLFLEGLLQLVELVLQPGDEPREVRQQEKCKLSVDLCGRSRKWSHTHTFHPQVISIKIPKY